MALTPADLRILIKRSTNTGEVPTAAPSTDHTDGTWDSLDIYKGELFINVADNKLWMRTDSGIVQLYPSSGGITSLNGLTAATQTFAVGTSGTDFAISSATSIHTFNLPTASASARGALSSSDWTTFNNKIGGSLTSGRVPYASGTSTLTDTSLFVFDGTKLGVGIASPTATIHAKGADAVATNKSLIVQNSAGVDALYVMNDGAVAFGYNDNASGTYYFWNRAGSVSTNDNVYIEGTNCRNGLTINNGYKSADEGRALNIIQSNAAGRTAYGVYASVINGGTNSYGVYLDVRAGSSNTKGVEMYVFQASGGSQYGLDIYVGQYSGTSYGVKVNNYSTSNSSTTYGVHSSLTGKGTPVSVTQVAGYFKATGGNTDYALQTDGKVSMANLPTSAAGLSTGDLWNNGGVINIA